LLLVGLPSALGFSFVSTHRCNGEADALRTTCTFENLCTDGEKFYYYRNKGSTLDKKLEGNVAVLSVFNSPAQLRVEDVGEAGESRAVGWADDPSFIFVRLNFNYFHALLDEYMGLFHIMLHAQPDTPSQNNQVLWWDKDPHPSLTQKRDPFPALRGAISAKRHAPFTDFVLAHRRGNDRLCFKSISVGPAQHGLGGPGAVHVSREKLAAFVAHFRKGLGLPVMPPPLTEVANAPKTILVSQRSGTRFLLNADEVVKELQDALPEWNVKLIEFAKLEIKDQVTAVAEASVLVGMHGADLCNMVWLRPSPLATVVELMPYKVLGTVYPSLAAKAGVRYLSWKNEDRERTVFHEEVADRFRLTEEEKRILKTVPYSERTPEAFKVDGMAYHRYWTAQDTHADAGKIVDIVRSAIRMAEAKPDELR
jgi:hypothetical protein